MSNRKKVTLKDVSAACGYSMNTVSRALRDDTKLPAETIERIKAAADELGYMRNGLASTLRSGRTNLVAVIVEDVQNPYYATLLTQISISLREAGYRTLMLGSLRERNYVDRSLPFALSYNVSGIILFPKTDTLPSIRIIQQNQIPLVLVTRNIEGSNADSICCDDYQGGYLVGQQLAAEGHRRLLWFAGPDNNPSQTLRYKGLLDALSQHGITEDCVRSVSNQTVMDAILNETLADILLPVNYTAIACINDSMCYYVMAELSRQGYSIPSDVSVIGFDHLRGTQPYLSPLTSIAAHMRDRMGEIAVQMLVNRIKHPDAPICTRVLPVALYDQGTTRGIAYDHPQNAPAVAPADDATQIPLELYTDF